MIELKRSNDLAFLSFLEAMLKGEGLSPVILDGFISSAEGGVSAFERRLCVPNEEGHAARALLALLEADHGG